MDAPIPANIHLDSDPAVALSRPTFQVVCLMTAMAAGIGAQWAVASGRTNVGVAAYGAAVLFVLAGTPSIVREPVPAEARSPLVSRTWRGALVIVAMVAALFAFSLSSGNRYRITGVGCWIASVFAWWLAWVEVKQSVLPDVRKMLRKPLLVGLIAVIFFAGAVFRFSDLTANPQEMTSDHAEKLLDIKDVLRGETAIFFERNTGREPWQFYMTVGLIKTFGLKPDFMALKIGTALMGLLMLPGVFLLANEVLGRRTAVLAVTFAAVTSWAVIPARFGLRPVLAPCAVAWTMYFLVRGLRRNDRNAMLAAGLCMGVGLHGYMAFRFMPVVFAVMVLIAAGWHGLGRRRSGLLPLAANSGLSLFTTVLVLVPLLRYAVESPGRLWYRVTTRMTGLERPIEGNVIEILIGNLRDVMLFFNFSHDVVPVSNLPGEPATDAVVGSLLVIGAAATIMLLLRSRDPWAIAMLLSGFLMLFPSALSIAFPGENPSLTRSGGAIPMLMIVAATVPGLVLECLRRLDRPWLRAAAIATVATVTASVVALNTDRNFRRYPAHYCSAGINASDIARELQGFVEAGNPPENGWLVSYPHWVDHRCVGIWMGDISFSNVLTEPNQIVEIPPYQRPAIFALNENDGESLRLLTEIFPQGEASMIAGKSCSDRRFLVFTTD